MIENIGLMVLLMGVGVVAFIGIIFAFLSADEFLKTWYLKD